VKIPAGQWAIMGLLGVPTGLCAYLIYFGVAVGDSNGIWLFVALGSLFGIPLLAMIIRIAGRHSRLFGHMDRKLMGTAEAYRPHFVPHWFLMTCICVLGFVIVLAILQAVFTIWR